MLGYVGSLESWIDLKEIPDWFSLVRKRYPDATLMIVLFRIMKFKKWLAYIGIVVVLSTLMGFTYGMIV